MDDFSLILPTFTVSYSLSCLCCAKSEFTDTDDLAEMGICQRDPSPQTNGLVAFWFGGKVENHIMQKPCSIQTRWLPRHLLCPIRDSDGKSHVNFDTGHLQSFLSQSARRLLNV